MNAGLGNLYRKQEFNTLFIYKLFSMSKCKDRCLRAVRGTQFIIPQGQNMKSVTSGKFDNINMNNWKQMDNEGLISYYMSSCFKKMQSLLLLPGNIFKRACCITEEVDNKETEFFCSLWG